MPDEITTPRTNAQIALQLQPVVEGNEGLRRCTLVTIVRESVRIAVLAKNGLAGGAQAGLAQCHRPSSVQSINRSTIDVSFARRKSGARHPRRSAIHGIQGSGRLNSGDLGAV
jgi:hypothetical protein